MRTQYLDRPYREPPPMREPFALTRAIPLRWRITILAAVVVACAVAVVATAAYLVVYRALSSEMDSHLRDRANAMTNVSSLTNTLDVTQTIYSFIVPDDIDAMVYVNGTQVLPVPGVPIGPQERAVISGQKTESLRTFSGLRVLAVHAAPNVAVVVWTSTERTDDMLTRLAWVLSIIGICGVILAAIAGHTVADTGLRPVRRVTRAAERVAKTNDLHPISVTGNDELARMSEAFNEMLGALADSRERQSRLVADAGHELRTPLTSLRTNIELLMAATQPGAPALPEADMAELRDDVLGQISELSTLVGDLVDLAREDTPEVIYEEFDLRLVAERALERVRRRRQDVTFVAEIAPWYMIGSPQEMSRALVNVLDNAAKWAPTDGRVTVRLAQTEDFVAELVVADNGPGIDPAERDLIFERFYRSTSSRSMPGSGLGLAIVRQTVVHHGGAIVAEEAPGGGAQLRMVLAGRPTPQRATTTVPVEPVDTLDAGSSVPPHSGFTDSASTVKAVTVADTAATTVADTAASSAEHSPGARRVAGPEPAPPWGAQETKDER